MTSSGRDAFKLLLAGSLIAPQAARAVRAAGTALGDPHWAPGIEGQRKADLGNGTYLNPIIAGDHPDPTILKDGGDYYMTFSSFFAHPGVVTLAPSGGGAVVLTPVR